MRAKGLMERRGLGPFLGPSCGVGTVASRTVERGTRGIPFRGRVPGRMVRIAATSSVAMFLETCGSKALQRNSSPSSEAFFLIPSMTYTSPTLVPFLHISTWMPLAPHRFVSSAKGNTSPSAGQASRSSRANRSLSGSMPRFVISYSARLGRFRFPLDATVPGIGVMLLCNCLRPNRNSIVRQTCCEIAPSPSRSRIKEPSVPTRLNKRWQCSCGRS